MIYRSFTRIAILFLVACALVLFVLQLTMGREPWSPAPVSLSPTPVVTRTIEVTPTPAPALLPLIPYGTYSGPSYSHLKPHTRYVYMHVTYTLQAGKSGRLWGFTPAGQQVLLYGASAQYRSKA